jgi:hypothetical protein
VWSGRAGGAGSDSRLAIAEDARLLERTGHHRSNWPSISFAAVVRRKSKGSTASPRRRRLRATYRHPARPSSPRRARHEPGQALRAHQGQQETHHVLGVLPVPAFAVSTGGAHRDRDGQLQSHLATKKDGRVAEWAAAKRGAGLRATNASFLNRIQCHFTALRYFALNGTDHRNHEEQNSMIRRYIIWRNRHTNNKELRAISWRPKVA